MSIESKEPVMLPQSLEKLQIISTRAIKNNQSTTTTINNNNTFNPFRLEIIKQLDDTSDTNDVFRLKNNCAAINSSCRTKKQWSTSNNGSVNKIEDSLAKASSFKSKGTLHGRKLLREPVLKFLDTVNRHVPKNRGNLSLLHHSNNYNADNDRAINENCLNHYHESCKLIDFKSLVDDCANLTLSASFMARAKCIRNNHPAIRNTHNNNKHHECHDKSSIIQPSNVDNSSVNTSCSQQALFSSSNCDVTIDELASYFETFVHIPKKMSTMAEMMYI